MVADKIRSLKVLNHVDFMILGDPIKSIFFPMWGKETGLPDVYQNTYQKGGSDKIIINIWALSNNTDATYRMFPLDGTVNTGFDYSIIFYDAVTRKKSESIDLWVSIKNQIASKQHEDRKCNLVVIIVKTPKTQNIYSEISSYCEKNNIHKIIIENNEVEITKIKDLLKNLSDVVYKERKQKLVNKVTEILKNQA